MTAVLDSARTVVHWISDLGERRGWEWLAYNPVTMLRYHQLAAPDARALVDALERSFPEARVLIDVGAGSGVFSAEWRRRRGRVYACERNAFGRMLARMQGVRAVPFSLDREPPAQVGTGFDLALCLEVAEHVPAEFASRLVAFLVTLAPFIVFSSAPPGQGGHLHVNEQPASYWDALFAEHGYAFDVQRSARLSSAFQKSGVKGPWYIENTRVFATPDGSSRVNT